MQCGLVVAGGGGSVSWWWRGLDEECGEWECEGMVNWVVLVSGLGRAGVASNGGSGNDARLECSCIGELRV